MLFKKKRIISLEREVEALRGQVSRLEEKLGELGKKTISQKTMEKQPVSYNQIVDEWVNGEDEDG
ncbi:MAG: hypothetical protein IJX38_01240 [Clostridia bacterium]|nr:hypothetical protein [Clostridia bacterium]